MTSRAHVRWCSFSTTCTGPTSRRSTSSTTWPDGSTTCGCWSCTTYRPAEMALAQHPFLGIANNLRSRGLFEEIGLGFLARSGRGSVSRARVSRAPPAAGFLGAHPCEDGGQPALHGRPRAIPARLGRDHRTERHLGPRPFDVRHAARPAGIGAQHDREKDRAGRRTRPCAAARGERTGARVRFDDRQRGASKWILPMSRNGSTCSSACTCSSNAAASTSFPI